MMKTRTLDCPKRGERFLAAKIEIADQSSTASWKTPTDENVERLASDCSDLKLNFARLNTSRLARLKRVTTDYCPSVTAMDGLPICYRKESDPVGTGQPTATNLLAGPQNRSHKIWHIIVKIPVDAGGPWFGQFIIGDVTAEHLVTVVSLILLIRN